MSETHAIDPLGLVGTTLEGRFRVDRLVARGGFGYVYAGRHLALDSAVALKVMHETAARRAAAQPDFFVDFAREARMAARLRHPHIVHVLDHGVAPLPHDARTPWIALEWLEGATLRAELEARRGQGGRTPDAALALLRPVLEALAYAHDERVAHRDVKPDNVVLAAEDRRGSATKLLDFGIAKQLTDEGLETGSGETRTDTALRAFSLAYAAPEQVSGTRTGPWTDVHAMGLILTEVLTDALPYDGNDRTEMYCDVLAARRPTPAKRGVDVGAWEAVIARAVALRPADRLADAGALLRALEEALPAARHVPGAIPVATAPFAGIALAARETMARTIASTVPDASTRPRRTWRLVVRAALAVVATLSLATLVARSTVHEPAPRPVRSAAFPPQPIVPEPTVATPVIAPVVAGPSPLVAVPSVNAPARTHRAHARHRAVHRAAAVNGHTVVRVQ